MSLKAIVKEFTLGDNSYTTVLGVGYSEGALWRQIFMDEDYLFPSMYGEPPVLCEYVVSHTLDDAYVMVVKGTEPHGVDEVFGTIVYSLKDTQIISSKFGS